MVQQGKNIKVITGEEALGALVKLRVDGSLEGGSLGSLPNSKNVTVVIEPHCVGDLEEALTEVNGPCVCQTEGGCWQQMCSLELFP